MEKPDMFFMENYKDYKGENKKEYYMNLMRIILDHGYNLSYEGINNETKKYAWKFVRANAVINEHWENFKGVAKDEAYWKKHDEQAMRIVEGMRRHMKEK